MRWLRYAAAFLFEKTMTIVEIDRIIEARQRVIERGQTPSDLVDEVTAEHLVVSVEMVKEARETYAKEFA